MTYKDYFNVLPKDLLESEYNTQLLTQQELSTKYNISKANLIKLLKAYNITKDSEAHTAAIKKAKLKHFGNANYNNRNKAKETCRDKFGVENPFQNKDFIKNFQEVKREKYGSTNNIKKNHETRIKNAGSLAKSYELQQITYRRTCQQRYHQNNAAKVDQNKQKIKATWRDKTIEDFIEIKNKSWKNYFYDNYYFDSLPELAYYMYTKAGGPSIRRSDKRLEYYFNGELHYYFPDFEVDDRLIEIKSDHLFKQMQIPNTLDNAKYQCMLDNNVEILTSMAYTKYIKWFKVQGNKKEDFMVIKQ